MTDVMQVPEGYRDLLDAQYATMATIDPTGRPQLSYVWFLAEDGKVKVSLNTQRKKVRNLRRNPACTVFIIDPANPGRYLEIRGDARIEPDDNYEFASRVGAKYNADLRAFDGPGQQRVVVTVEPVRVNGVTIF
ncbi:MAG: PPOX class F420-dependent oxidoreductase [Micromonosporaceae bacterium]|nr:PPOX class F420-dependent oxidoreductase [Micromonosporaceae bacterium]